MSIHPQSAKRGAAWFATWVRTVARSWHRGARDLYSHIP